jgi:hypothetical protein
MSKPERWRRIAIRVPAKTIGECYQRAKEMRIRLQRELERHLKSGKEDTQGNKAKSNSHVITFSVEPAKGGGSGVLSEGGGEEEEFDEEPGEEEEEEEEEEESEGEGEEGEKSHIRPLGSEMGEDGRISLTGERERARAHERESSRERYGLFPCVKMCEADRVDKCILICILP